METKRLLPWEPLSNRQRTEAVTTRGKPKDDIATPTVKPPVAKAIANFVRVSRIAGCPKLFVT
jgi:hypothetical protein